MARARARRAAPRRRRRLVAHARPRLDADLRRGTVRSCGGCGAPRRLRRPRAAAADAGAPACGASCDHARCRRRSGLALLHDGSVLAWGRGEHGLSASAPPPSATACRRASAARSTARARGGRRGRLPALVVSDTGVSTRSVVARTASWGRAAPARAAARRRRQPRRPRASALSHARVVCVAAGLARLRRRHRHHRRRARGSVFTFGRNDDGQHRPRRTLPRSSRPRRRPHSPACVRCTSAH